MTPAEGDGGSFWLLCRTGWGNSGHGGPRGMSDVLEGRRNFPGSGSGRALTLRLLRAPAHPGPGTFLDSPPGHRTWQYLFPYVTHVHRIKSPVFFSPNGSNLDVKKQTILKKVSFTGLWLNLHSVSPRYLHFKKVVDDLIIYTNVQARSISTWKHSKTNSGPQSDWPSCGLTTLGSFCSSDSVFFTELHISQRPQGRRVFFFCYVYM